MCDSPGAPGIISANPYAGAHAFPPAFAIQQATGESDRPLSDTCLAPDQHRWIVVTWTFSQILYILRRKLASSTTIEWQHYNFETFADLDLLAVVLSGFQSGLFSTNPFRSLCTKFIFIF